MLGWVGSSLSIDLLFCSSFFLGCTDGRGTSWSLSPLDKTRGHTVHDPGTEAEEFDLSGWLLDGDLEDWLEFCQEEGLDEHLD